MGRDEIDGPNGLQVEGRRVELMPGTDGLVHICELAPYRVANVSDLVKAGDEMTVKVVSIDETGRVRLSRKAVIMESPDYDPARYEGMEMSVTSSERSDRGGRGDDRGGRSGGGGDRGGRGGPRR